MSDKPRIVLIGCEHSAGVAVEDLTRTGKALPPNVEWVSIPCGGGLDELTILRAFEDGAEQVMVLACCDGACRSLDGSRWAAKRVAAVRSLLAEAGIAGWRLAFKQIAPTMSADLLQWIESFREPVSAEGPMQGAGAVAAP